MDRLVPVALCASLLAAPAAAQSVSKPDGWRLTEVNFADGSAFQLPGTKVGDQGRIGIGMFGFKADQARQRAVVVRDIDAPRQRRAGVGLSLKF